MHGRDGGGDIASVMRMGSCRIRVGGRGIVGWYDKEGGLVRNQWTDHISFPPGVVSCFLALHAAERMLEVVGQGPSLSGLLKR